MPSNQTNLASDLAGLLLGVCPLVNYLPFLGLCLLICKMVIIMLPIFWDCYED